MEGSGNSSPNTTIPSILQKMINYNDGEYNVKVINAGGGGGTSVYEKKLIKNTIVNYEPDLIIILGGWNDLSADYSVTGVLEKYQQTCVLAYENNFNLKIFLQPIAGFGNKILTDQEKINSLTGEDHNGFQLLQAKSTYDWFGREFPNFDQEAKIQLGNGICNFYDLRDIFDNVSGAIYWDQGHISDVGNFIVADNFLKELAKSHPKHFSYDEKFTNIISKYNHPSITELLLYELDIDTDYSTNSFMDMTTLSLDNNGKGNYLKLKTKFGIDKILVGTDLRNTNLNKLNLKDQDLTGANLSGQDLRNIDLTDTIIRGANLSYTNLEGKDLSGMDIRGIDFSNANMKNVDFTDAIFSKLIQIAPDSECHDELPFMNAVKNLRCVAEVIPNESIRTDFTNADLTNTTFGNGEIGFEPGDISQNQIVFFADFTNANLTDATFNNVQFNGCNFTNAILNGVTGEHIFIVKSDFSNSQMNNIEISLSWFQLASFYNTSMTGGTFDYITFIENDFTDTNLENTTIKNLRDIGDNNFSCKNNAICIK